MPSNEILTHLSRDQVMKTLIEKCELKDRPAQSTVYEALMRSINFQQLSGASATAIHNRFLDLFPDKYPGPKLLLELSADELRKAGLSRQKTNYVQNTARFFLEHDLMDTDWKQNSDEEIINQLTRIKGVGRWTVEMILMFTLKRPDVLPFDDLVIRNNMMELYSVNSLQGKARKQKLLQIAEPWRPYRTTASRYLWQWKDTKL